MKGSNLGEFEELVLLVVVALFEDPYSVSIAKEINRVTSRKIVHSVVHTVLHRLVKKGLVQSKMVEGTKKRGGRRKRIYSITASGMAALQTMKTHRDTFWNMISPSKIAETYGR